MTKWPSRTLGTLDLGRNKMKRANREYQKALAKTAERESDKNLRAADEAWLKKEKAITACITKIEHALKKFDR